MSVHGFSIIRIRNRLYGNEEFFTFFQFLPKSHKKGPNYRALRLDFIFADLN
ncbi:hypothetical protein AO498_01132 [Algoriphagus sanaruensis]|uniref:Uncharacterized protein n=1 Tax=Algoriphagus sanaruensis TaxID=1727163 RepID=A0A142EIL9_9BACT|nr:hypothetical protein AO498_01132 [Algoriphagus sanaruensis]